MKVDVQPASPANRAEIPLHGALLMMARRIAHLAALARVRKPERDSLWPPDMCQVWRAIVSKASSCSLDADDMPCIVPHSDPWTKIVTACGVTSARIQATARAQEANAKAQRKEALVDRLTKGPKALAEAYKLLRDPPKRMSFVTTSEGITCDPQRIDQEIIKQWGSIYQGNVEGAERWAHAQRLVYVYRPYIFAAPQQSVPPITAEDGPHSFCTRPTAAGPDAWSLTELKYMSRLAAEWLARLYASIEAGAPWPTQTQISRSVFLAKTAGSCACTDVRILTITSVMYRRWAAARLYHLQPLANQWLTPEMCGGVKSNAADSASWAMALEVEGAVTEGSGASAASLDIYKCFDQMSREVIVLLARRAGAPEAIISSWYRMLAGLRTYNSLCGTAGVLYGRPASIPQGCPLSMLWLNLALRPLIILTRTANALPRALADDLTVMARGLRHWARVRNATTLSIIYLEDLGARVSRPKCALLSTSPAARASMRKHKWPILPKPIKVTVTARDLGPRSASVQFPIHTYLPNAS